MGKNIWKALMFVFAVCEAPGAVSWHVVTADNKPAENALVTVLSPIENKYVKYASLHGDELQATHGQSISTRCDAEGNFYLTTQPTTGYLLITGKAGFAAGPTEALAKRKELTLTPWVRVEGVWLNCGHPMIGQKLSPSFDGEIGKWIGPSNPVLTDEHGRFSFVAFPSTNVSINWFVPIGESGSGMMRANTLFETRVAAQSKGEIRILTSGRSIKGKLSSVSNVEELPSAGEWQVFMQPDIAPPEPPKEADTPEKIDRWYEEWSSSPEGKRNHELSHNDRNGIVHNDLTFSLEAVIPGKYSLHALFSSREGVEAGLDQKVEIPEGDSPFDLGKLMYKQLQVLKVGELAPNFQGPTFDGRTLRLGDFKGKFVLLDFWAVWCGLCVEEMPNILKVYEKYHADPRLAIVSLSSDKDLAVAKRFAETHGTNVWHQVFLGFDDPLHVSHDYHIRGIPSIMLVGPDGRILAMNLRGPDIASAVEKVLSTTSKN